MPVFLHACGLLLDITPALASPAGVNMRLVLRQQPAWVEGVSVVLE